MTEIMFTSNTLEFDTRKIWDSANSHQHYIVFLEDEISFVKSDVMIEKRRFCT